MPFLDILKTGEKSWIAQISEGKLNSKKNQVKHNWNISVDLVWNMQWCLVGFFFSDILSLDWEIISETLWDLARQSLPTLGIRDQCSTMPSSADLPGEFPPGSAQPSKKTLTQVSKATRLLCLAPQPSWKSSCFSKAHWLRVWGTGSAWAPAAAGAERVPIVWGDYSNSCPFTSMWRRLVHSFFRSKRISKLK